MQERRTLSVPTKKLINLERQAHGEVNLMPTWLKNTGLYAVGLLVFAGLFVLCALMLHGMVWASEKLLPWLAVAGRYAFDVCLLMLPLCLFRKTRPWAGGVFYF